MAFIYPGPHNDGGWSQSHDRGRLAIEKALGNKVETTYKENIFSNAQVPQVVAGLVREGYDMIFGCSFGMFENGVNGQLYSKYPDVLFEQATGLQVKKNQSEYFGAGEDTIYLSGMAAGAATKNGQIGYIVPFGIPEVVRHINAFALGAQAMNPKAKVRLLWTNSWFSPPKETAAAKNLIAAGVDVLGQNVDSPAAGVVAESKGVPWVGYDSDARKSAPKQWLTAATYNWGPYYVKRVRAAINGSWKSGFYYGTIKDGFTGLAPYGPKVTAKTKAAIAAKRKAIVSGKFNVFQGPLYDQKGKLWCRSGQDAQGPPGSLLDAVARQGCGREGLDGRASGLAGGAGPRIRGRRERRRFARRLSCSRRAHGGDHEAVPRRRRERRRDLRGRGRRGARAPRRERRRQDDALEHPDRPLPPGRGRDRALRRAGAVPLPARRASTRGSAWCISTSGWSSRSPSPRTSCSAITAAREVAPFCAPSAHRAARGRARASATGSP